MNIQVKSAIAEIIRKECERYRLLEFGLLPSVEEGVGVLFPLYSSVEIDMLSDIESFVVWRKRVLKSFYEQIGYSQFLSRQKRKVSFGRFLFFLQKRLLLIRWRQNEIPTLDDYLATPSRTLAFKLSTGWSEDNREVLWAALDKAVQPSEVEEGCRAFCEQRFPLTLDDVLRRLDKDDEEFWHEIYILLKKMASGVTSHFGVSISYKKEIEQDTWSDASVWLHDKWKSGVLPLFETAAHFRNYMVRVCINKQFEANRRNRPQMAYISDADPEIETALARVIDCAEQMEAEPELTDMDDRNEGEVSRVLTSILWNRTEPWYSRLVAGQEDKVETLLLHYTEGKSYEEIADMRGGDGTDERRHKLCCKLRQDTVRIRKTLKERFIKLVSEHRLK